MMKNFIGENSAEPQTYWFRSNVHFLFCKIFYDVFYSAKAKAVNGKARTYGRFNTEAWWKGTLFKAAQLPVEADGARRLCFKLSMSCGNRSRRSLTGALDSGII